MRKGEGWKGRGGEGGGGSMLNVYTDISAFWRASVTIYRILASVQWVEIRLHVCVCMLLHYVVCVCIRMASYPVVSQAYMYVCWLMLCPCRMLFHRDIQYLGVGIHVGVL